MLKSQKSVRGGIEDFLCCFTDLFITQGPNESYSHKGIMAWDVRGAKAGIKYPYYAGATSKCLKTYPESGQVMWQTVDKVRCANGYIGKVTYMTVHDDTMDAHPGLVVPQGNQLGNMGKKGNATGVHCHIEFTQSDDTTWKKNSYGNYMFNNEVDPEDIFFMDNTNILNGIGNWKYLKDVPVEEPKKEEPTAPPVDEDKVKIEELEEELNSKKEEIKLLNARIEELEIQVKSLNKVQEVVDKENDKLKEQLEEQPTLIFTSPNTDYYAIRLEENQQLYLK